MKVEINGIKISMTKDIEDFIQKKIKKLNRYFKGIISCYVILKSEKTGYETEITLTAKGLRINGKGNAADLYSSVEDAIDKVVRQSKKYKEKKKSHRVTVGAKNPRLGMRVGGEETEDRPAVVKVKRELAKPMSVDEAVMQLNLSKDNFFVFLNAETNNVNVIYRREDGTFGLIEPE